MTDIGKRPFSDTDFARLDGNPDALFYSMPRLVTHIDDAACAALSGHYADFLRDGDRVLDVMSSCVSHLPTTWTPGEVVGHGMNTVELEANPQLDSFFVQDLNKTPALPFEEASFDACLIAVSVQYLVNPIAVFTEICRILRPGGQVAVSFSNRMFPTKAVTIWRESDDSGRCRLVADYLGAIAHLKEIQITDLSPQPGHSDPLFIVTACRA
jgi:SAM-dependent methyltransferase